MSSQEDESSKRTVSEESVSQVQQFEELKAKFLAILEDRFFGNLKHDWRRSTADDEQRTDSLPSYHSLSSGSGSYLILDGKRVSFDWFRMALGKPLPKLETKIEPVSIAPEERISEIFDNPYTVRAPEEMTAKAEAGDRFHTHKSRAREGMRSRLLVKDVAFEEETLGYKRKHQSKLATQMDAHYRNEISYRPRIRNFMRVDAIHRLRDNSRKQFETYYRKEYLLKKTEVEKVEKQCHKDLHERCAELIQAIRVFRQQRFSSSMRVLDKVKPCYEETARWEAKYREWQQKMVALWNKVIQLESIWSRRIKYQNFLYLIMPKSWREKYDWIHMDEEGKLEGYPESIAKRDSVNLRKLEAKNDIWAVKEFFEKEYREKEKPVHAAYEDVESLMKGIAELDVNSLTLLSRLNLLSWIKIEAAKKAEEVRQQYEKTIQNLRYSIADLVQKESSYHKRSAELKQQCIGLSGEPLRVCVGNQRSRSIETLLFVLYKQLLPPGQRENALKFSGTESFSYVFNAIIQLLGSFDRIPPKLLASVEKQVRFKRKVQLRIAQRAAEEDHRHQLMAVQLKRSLAPRYVRPPRTGKLPRSRLKKKPVQVVMIPPVVTKLDKVFKKAFGADAVMTQKERNNLEIDLAFRNYGAVQFDHFLRSIGYEPERDFVAQVQQRDGPETNFFKRVELIPKVMQRMTRWDAIQAKVKERLIQRISETFEP